MPGEETAGAPMRRPACRQAVWRSQAAGRGIGYGQSKPLTLAARERKKSVGGYRVSRGEPAGPHGMEPSFLLAEPAVCAYKVGLRQRRWP